MKFLTALRLGFHRVHRRWGVVLLAYLAALAPALLVAATVHSNLAGALDASPFAGRVFSGGRVGVWTDFANSPDHALGPVWEGLGLRFLVVLVVQILVSAGMVETLLGATPRRDRPFLRGVGRHGGPFLRAAVWFFAALGAVAAVFAAAWAALDDYARGAGDGALHLYGGLGLALLFGLAFVPLKLGYDLSRVAAAAHGDRSTFGGFLRALGHAAAHPGILGPLYLTFALAALALHAGYFAARDVWEPGGPATALLLFAAQQAILLLRAYLRAGLWASEIAYYQAIGEPRWCRRGGAR